MKELIHNVIRKGNQLLRRRIWIHGRRIYPDELDAYNLEIRELKSYCYSQELKGSIKEILDIVIKSYEELQLIENLTPPRIIDGWILARWTGDLFLSKQTMIKYYIRSINMRLDIILRKYSPNI